MQKCCTDRDKAAQVFAAAVFESSRRAAAGRAQLLAKRGHSGRMQFPEKTAAIGGGSDGSDGSGFKKKKK